MKMLLAVDDSPFGLAAADVVAGWPGPPGAIVWIVQVKEPASEATEVEPARTRPPFAPPPYAIGKALGRLDGNQLNVEAKILAGGPKPAILNEAFCGRIARHAGHRALRAGVRLPARRRTGALFGGDRRRGTELTT